MFITLYICIKNIHMIELIKSQKNEMQIIFNGYVFGKKRITRTHQIWRCLNKPCKATARTSLDFQSDLNSFVQKGEHNHPSDVNNVAKRKAIFEMKEYIQKTHIAPRSIMHTTLRGAESEKLIAVGNFESIRRRLTRHRSNQINPHPYLYQTLKISRKLSLTHLGEQFYRYGIDNFGHYEVNNDFLLFFSDFMILRLVENRIWCMDGTFSVVPSPYTQLYTIGYLNNHHVYPCIFAVIKNKKRETYEKLFNLIKSILLGISPEIIKIDFEFAAIQALNLVFPNSKISGCMFHLGQCVFRKVQKLGLASVYHSNNLIKKYTKALCALAF